MIYESKHIQEKPRGRSEVIPNQALSLRQIIEKSSRGMMLSEVRANQLQYGDDEDEDGRDLFTQEDDIFDVHDRLSYYEQRLQQEKEVRKASIEAQKQSKNASEEAKGTEAPKDAKEAEIA